jgi:hypothetical protein
VSRYLLVVSVVSGLACSSDRGEIDAGSTRSDDAGRDAAAACTALFGLPAENTGLTAAQCGPSCPCKGYTFEPFDDAVLDVWQRARHLNPPAELVADPYEQPAPEIHDEVCGVLVEEAGYRTQTFASETLALQARATLTHYGPCGACSSLANLAVYARYTDLTQPVRQCGLEGISRGMQANLDCLLELGFELPCAQIWFYNTRHTREACLGVCLALLDAPYHTEDGALNDCLLCDERESGPVFKAIAGRTRRNTGLASALCRPCDEVRPLSHDYPPGP